MTSGVFRFSSMTIDADRVPRCVLFGRLRALLNAAGIEHRERPALGRVVEPLAAPGLRFDVPDLGDPRAEDRVHERRLARATPPDERKRWGALLEQHGPQQRDLRANVFHGVGVKRKKPKHLFDAADVLGDDLARSSLLLPARRLRICRSDIVSLHHRHP